MYSHILVALDGSPEGERILPHVEALAEKFQANVTIARVTTSPTMMIAETTASADQIGGAPFVNALDLVDDERKSTSEYLEGVAGRIRALGVTVDCQEPEGDAADVIDELARTTGADLIALTTHARTGLGRLVMGSVADAIIRRAPCPVLVLRTHDDA